MAQYDPELLAVFTQESRENIDVLEPSLLLLEANPSDKNTINKIFRAVHSIKGASGFFALTTIAKLSHTMESLMSLVRDGEIVIHKAMISALLAATDKLRIMIDDVLKSDGVDASAEQAVIQSFIDNTQAPLQKTVTITEKVAVLPSNLQHFQMDPQLVRHALKHGRCIYVIKLFTKKDIKDKGKTPLDFFKEVESLGEFIDAAMDLSGISGLDDALNVDLSCDFLFSTIMQPDLLQVAFDIPQHQIECLDPSTLKEWIELHIEVKPTASESQSKDQHIAQAPEPEVKPNIPVEPEVTKSIQASNKVADETVRVSVALLDDLMNLAGEMVLGRNQLLRTCDQLSKDVPGMQAILQNINRVTSDLQEKVMLTRLQPLSVILGKFKRIIRDLGQKLQKEIELETIGEEVELDKSIIEALSDPLTHLIRNCADHAIEMPSDRQAAGKSRIGRVVLSAKHVAGQVHIEVQDDGRGLDVERIRKKALEKKLITPEEAASMSRRQLMNLIFLPGFSTAEKVTDVSGRGVGMDVVKTNIERLGGSIDLYSEVGKGTTVYLKLPLTLAIIPAMIIGADNRRFAVPQVNLEEIVRITPDTPLEHIQHSLVLRLRNQLVPVVHFGELLGTPQPKDHPISGYVLILTADQHRYGLLVDALLDNEEIVVKPINSFFKGFKLYSGATILGDGKVAMIVDASGIAELAKIQLIHHAEQDPAEVLANQKRQEETQTILIFSNAGSERFALNLSMVARIEKIDTKNIEKLGKKEYVKYQDSSLRLVRLDEFLPVTARTERSDHLYIIIPKLIRHPMGIIATQIDDIIHDAIHLDLDTVTDPGILGSSVIKGQLTLFIDIYKLFEIVDPEHYKNVTKGQKKFTGKRVLLAEDTPFFRTVSAQYLSAFVDHVDVAVNGQEAWNKINSESYDLIITDIEMPIMNGLELTQKIRAAEKFKRLPVIALTSLCTEVDRAKAKDAGVDAYHVKLDKESLHQTLVEYLK